MKIIIIDKILALILSAVLTTVFLFYIPFLEKGTLSLDEVKFIITTLSILAVFSHRYGDEKAHSYCFVFIILDILFFLAVRFSPYYPLFKDDKWKDSFDSTIVILGMNAFILNSIIFFLYSYIQMPAKHAKKKYRDYSYEIFKLFNKSINYSLNDNEKLKIKEFCESEIKMLKSKPIYRYRRYRCLKCFYKNPYNRKQYMIILKKIKMYYK